MFPTTNSVGVRTPGVCVFPPLPQVLLELKEYAQEVDVEFVRKAVRAIGRCAIKLERAAERCINVLLELIQTKVNYVLQEAVIVIKASVFFFFRGEHAVVVWVCMLVLIVVGVDSSCGGVGVGVVLVLVSMVLLVLLLLFYPRVGECSPPTTAYSPSRSTATHT